MHSYYILPRSGGDSDNATLFRILWIIDALLYLGGCKWRKKADIVIFNKKNSCKILFQLRNICVAEIRPSK